MPGIDPHRIPADVRRLVADARVARLATVRPEGGPHVVPVTFALTDDTVVTAVDHKPKRTNDLQRLRNVAANPVGSLLVDHYDEDWSLLWWARLDGTADVVDESDREALLAPLVAKYAQYAAQPPQGPVLRLRVTGWAAWSAGQQPG